MSELLPCPFCGNKAHYVEPASGAASYVTCHACFASQTPSNINPIDKWNIRTPSTLQSQLDTAVEALEAANGRFHKHSPGEIKPYQLAAAILEAGAIITAALATIKGEQT